MKSQLRILINDYAGHPFQVQLSRWLASAGHCVLHTYCSSVQTPRGSLRKLSPDPKEFEVKPVSLGRQFDKYGLVSRGFQEYQLGGALVREFNCFAPDVVISANTPLIAQQRLMKACQKSGVPFILWLQDVLSIGIKSAMRKKLPILGNFIGHYFSRLEYRLWHQSDCIVAITQDFVSLMTDVGVDEKNIFVIENWAPLKEISVESRDNCWSRQENLVDRKCILYSGTLGLKHSPEILVCLAEEFIDDKDVSIVVISEGIGADYLLQEKKNRHLDNLKILPFQPYEKLSKVFASADLLLAILEPGSGTFAVPSKVLTYLCAKRPLLLSVPLENLAARTVKKAGAGYVFPPSDIDGFLKAARRLLGDTDERVELSDNARSYAEKTFDIDRIGRDFWKVIQSAFIMKTGEIV